MIKLNVGNLFNGNIEGCEFINEEYVNNILDMEFDLVFDGIEGIEIKEFDFSGCDIMLVKIEGYKVRIVKDGVNYYIDIVSN